jgi:restriction endonuclease Mrr
MNNAADKIFVWRGEINARDICTDPIGWVKRVLRETGLQLPATESGCPFCGCKYEVALGEVPELPSFTHWRQYEDVMSECVQCGFWHYTHVEHTPHTGEQTIHKAALLQKFDINSSELGLAELAAHLRRRFTDIYRLHPRRFEELVEDVFRNLGYQTRLTQQSRDGGFDIVLLESNSTGEKILVECKRYAANKTVSVSVVRQLVGVQLIEGVRRAKLVTSSRFTQPAKEISNIIESGNSGFSLELIDGDQLLRNLEVYNCKLPPLHLLDLTGNEKPL